MEMTSFMNAMQALNVILQSFWNLLTPIGLSLLAAWLLAEKAGVGGWIYAVLVPIGTLVGLCSMIRFILAAMKNLERLEKEQKQKKNERKGR